MKKYLTLGVLAALLSIALATAFGSSGSAATPVRFFDENCALSAEGNFDPIKFPGQSNITHLHQFACAVNINPSSTGASLKAANADGNKNLPNPRVCDVATYPNIPAGCSNNATPSGTVFDATHGGPGGQCSYYLPSDGSCPAFREFTGSAYWRPALYDCGPSSGPGAVPAPPKPDAVTDPNCHLLRPVDYHIYWFARQTVNSPVVESVPTGFSEIEGSKKIDNSGNACTPDTSGNPTAASTCQHEFRCLQESNQAPTYTSIDNGAEQSSEGYSALAGFLCGNAQGKSTIEANTHFAECVKDDGSGHIIIPPIPFVDTSDYSYAVSKQCLAPYTHLIPAIDMQVQYKPNVGTTPHWYLESSTVTNLDSTSQDHGDALFALDTSPTGLDPAASNEQANLIATCLNAASSQVSGCNVSP